MVGQMQRSLQIDFSFFHQHLKRSKYDMVPLSEYTSQTPTQSEANDQISVLSHRQKTTTLASCTACYQGPDAELNHQ